MSAGPATLPYGSTWPALETFTVLAQDRRVVPVVRRLLAEPTVQLMGGAALTWATFRGFAG